jgi:hypothetical protein
MGGVRRLVASSVTCLAATILFGFVALHTGRVSDWVLAGAAVAFTVATVAIAVARARAERRSP